MAEHEHVRHALQRKYAALLGEIEECRDRSAKLEADAIHVEACIRMWREDWDSDAAAPRRPRKPIRWMKQGQGVQTALEVLRDAERPLTTAEIAERMMVKRGITDRDRRSVKSLKSIIGAALSSKVEQGIVAEGSPKRWRAA